MILRDQFSTSVTATAFLLAFRNHAPIHELVLTFDYGKSEAPRGKRDSLTPICDSF